MIFIRLLCVSFKLKANIDTLKDVENSLLNKVDALKNELNIKHKHFLEMDDKCYTQEKIINELREHLELAKRVNSESERGIMSKLFKGSKKCHKF